MSQQLQISSAFSVIVLAALCLVASASNYFGSAAKASPSLVQAERTSGLLPG